MSKIITLTESDLYRIVKKILNEQTTTLNIGSGETISLSCTSIDNPGVGASFDGTVIATRNAKWGEIESGDTYVNTDIEVPSFTVSKKEEFGFLENQEILNNFYIIPLTPELANTLNITSVQQNDHVVVHYPKETLDMTDYRFYCQVTNATTFLNSQLTAFNLR